MTKMPGQKLTIFQMKSDPLIKEKVKPPGANFHLPRFFISSHPQNKFLQNDQQKKHPR